MTSSASRYLPEVVPLCNEAVVVHYRQLRVKIDCPFQYLLHVCHHMHKLFNMALSRACLVLQEERYLVEDINSPNLSSPNRILVTSWKYLVSFSSSSRVPSSLGRYAVDIGIFTLAGGPSFTASDMLVTAVCENIDISTG